MLIHCRTIPYPKTLPNYTLSESIAQLYPIFIHCRSIPYVNTLPNYTLSAYIAELYSILLHCRWLSAVNQIRAPKTSSANQNRAKRDSSFQPIRIEYFVTRQLSARVEVPSRLAVAFNTRALHPPPQLVCSLFYFWRINLSPGTKISPSA